MASALTLRASLARTVSAEEFHRERGAGGSWTASACPGESRWPSLAPEAPFIGGGCTEIPLSVGAAPRSTYPMGALIGPPTPPGIVALRRPGGQAIQEGTAAQPLDALVVSIVHVSRPLPEQANKERRERCSKVVSGPSICPRPPDDDE